MEEGLKKLEESGIIEVMNYHTFDFSITQPSRCLGFGQELPIDIEFSVSGFEKGNTTMVGQKSGFGQTIEEAILDLSLRFAGRK